MHTSDFFMVPDAWSPLVIRMTRSFILCLITMFPYFMFLNSGGHIVNDFVHYDLPHRERARGVGELLLSTSSTSSSFRVFADSIPGVANDCIFRWQSQHRMQVTPIQMALRKDGDPFDFNLSLHKDTHAHTHTNKFTLSGFTATWHNMSDNC